MVHRAFENYSYEMGQHMVEDLYIGLIINEEDK